MNTESDEKSVFIAGKYCKEIEEMPFYDAFYKSLQKVASSKEVNLQYFSPSLVKAMSSSGLETELRNDVYYWLKNQNLQYNGVHCWTEKEPLDYLRKAQMQWESRIYKSLNSMCSELGVSLSCLRLASDRDDIMDKWNMLSTYDIDLSQYRPVYAPKDFSDVLLNIKNPNHEATIFNDEFSRISLKVKTLSELKEMYFDLVDDKLLLGVCSASDVLYSKLEEERICLGDKVIESKLAPVAQEYLKRIAPHCLRGKLWSQVLGSDIHKWHEKYYDDLKKLVGQYDMLVDKLIIKDIQLTVCNDDQYFVFEDILYQVMLCLSRDTAMTSVFRYSSVNPIIGVLKGKPNTINNAVIYPPNGIIPFHGFTMYAAPLCYIYTNPVQLYFSIRSFYMRFWYKLHEVNSNSQGILALCILFQQLLEYHEPYLYSHFASISVQPVKIVFKWIMRCFSGHLPPEQLLYLWDLILGYESLEIVPLLAVGILSFRKKNLLQVDTLQNVEAVLADLSSIRIIPLLQFVIM